MQMEKGKFSQNTTRFKDKSKNVQPVVVEIDLVNSLIGNEVDKAPTVAAVNAGLREKITEEQAKKITEDAVKNIKIPEQVQADWSQNSTTSADYIKNKPNIKQGSGNYSIEENGGTATGDYAHAEGQNTLAEGHGARTEGKDTVSKGYYSHAEGLEAKALGHRTHAEGHGTTAGEEDRKEDTDGAHAEGRYTKAFGAGAHAEGEYSEARGYGSHAEGRVFLKDGNPVPSTSIGAGSHAEGGGTIAYGLDSHSEGRGTESVGDCSHTEGVRTDSKGLAAHAEGSWTHANGNYSHAEGNMGAADHAGAHVEGYGTGSTNDYQHVQGKFNATSETNLAHIIGGGTGWSDRKNIHTVDWEGNGWFSGNIKIGGNKYAEGKEVSTKEYVDEEITKVEALLGALIKSVEVEGHGGGWVVPEGVLPYFYFPSTEVEYSTGDYENHETATTHIYMLYFYDANFSLLGSEAAMSDTYYGIPIGTVRIGHDFEEQIDSLDPPHNYMAVTPCKLTFMVKVGI